MKLFFLVFSILFVLAPASVKAQGAIALDEQSMSALKKHPGLILPEGMLGHLEYNPPREPVFEKVRFLKLDPPSSLNERIERLIHGLYVDIPPEYDHYGYEIRRYMVSVGSPQILKSPKNIRGQIQNIKNAEIILKYWHEEHRKEIAVIENEIETRKASPSTRSSFKYHRGVSDAFFIEAQSWMTNNRKTLEYLLEIGMDAYQYRAPSFLFNDKKHFTKYAALYKAREDALKNMQDYTPFRMMVY